MTEALSRLDSLYTEYLEDMSRLSGEHHNLRGAFSRLFSGSSVGPGADSCNDRFYSGVKQCIDRCAQEGLSAGDSAQIIRYVLRQEHERSCGKSALLMMQAVHGCLLPLVGMLSPQTASEIAGEYAGTMEQAPLPVQKELLATLKKRSSAE